MSVLAREPAQATAAGLCGRCQDWFLRRGRWTRRLILMALGALAAQAFAPVDALPLFGFGIVGLIWAAETAARRRAAFWTGWWWGFGHCLAGFFWIANSFLIDPVRFGWMVPPVIAGLAAYMAVFPALAVAAAWNRRASPFAGVLLLAAVGAVAEGDPAAYVRGLVGLVVVRSVFWVLWWLRSAGMGFGDVRLSALLAFALGYLGWGELLVGSYAGFLLFGVPGLALAVLRRDRALLRTAYPFGPAMLAGAVLGVLVGGPVWAHLVNG